jgi:glutamate/tyrosine decarboxylase-like PLP-dependent enzyme
MHRYRLRDIARDILVSKGILRKPKVYLDLDLASNYTLIKESSCLMPIHGRIPTKVIRKQLRDSDLPDSGSADTESHTISITDAIPRNSVPTYFGFVTGGVTPAAANADHLTSTIDANVQVHMPDYSVTTDIEDTALRWLLQLFVLEPNDWRHRIFTTGATASNVLGLACGRDFVVQEAARRKGLEDISVAEIGLSRALDAVGVNGIQILTTMPHSSVRKAASTVGIGRDAVIDIGDPDPRRLPLFSMEQLFSKIKDKSVLSIVVVSCGEVNTGRFGTTSAMMKMVRDVCDDHGAWLHVDGGMILILKFS